MKYNTDRSFRLTPELQKQCRDYVRYRLEHG